MGNQRILTRAQLGAELTLILRRYVGVRENPLGSNSGRQVREIQAATSLAKSDPTGWPWCAALLAKGFEVLWDELDIALDPIWNNSASCDVLLADARKRGILYSAPAPYDVFLSMKSQYDAVHTGYNTDVLAGNRIATIEGNTNTAGSREGIGVFEFKGAQARSASGKTFIRWLNRLPEQIPCGKGGAAAEKPQRLIVGVAPFGPSNYLAIDGATLDNGVWNVPTAALARSGVPVKFPAPVMPIRDALKILGLTIDEPRTRLGNHLSDEADPRQYVFAA